MVDEKIAENDSLKEKDSDKNGSEVWAGGDGIVYIVLAKTLTEEDIWAVLDKTDKLLKGLTQKGKVLIDMSTSSIIRSSQFRRITAGKVKDIAMSSGFKKAAIYGGGVVLRTIASFIVMASGLHNIMIFNTSKEALEWLKQP